MPRQTDVNEIPSDKRDFVNSQEWEIDDARDFYFTGFEKVEKMSKAGKAYAQYLLYLLPIHGKEVYPEVTLGLFASHAASFKKASVKPYQKVTITKLNTEKGEDWLVTAGATILPEKDRPEVADYPEMKPYVNKDERPASLLASADEINIDDIPFE